MNAVNLFEQVALLVAGVILLWVIVLIFASLYMATVSLL